MTGVSRRRWRSPGEDNPIGPERGHFERERPDEPRQPEDMQGKRTPLLRRFDGARDLPGVRMRNARANASYRAAVTFA